MEEAVDPITRFVRACEPNESLRPSDGRYVNCDTVRGENGIAVYDRSLRRMSEGKFEYILFSGHRGVGKTSELLRLKERLERRERGALPFKVIYFDVTDALDPNDLAFPDLLVLVAAELQKQLSNAGIPGFGTVPTYLARVWDDIKTTLGAEVTLKDAEIDAGYAKLAVELRNRPNARKLLRSAIELHTSSLMKAVNDLLGESHQRLRSANYQGLVLIIDGLDKLVLRKLDDGHSNTHLRLFCDRADQLTSLCAHTIYTVPISLLYSPRCAELEQSFGVHIVPVPMIRLRGKDKAPVSPDTMGMQIMDEMIRARCKFAEVEFDDVFDDASTARYLCEMTGGHPRHLVMFLQASANTIDALPITKTAAEQAVSNYSNSLMREIPPEAWAKLRQFSNPTSDIPKDAEHQQMLFLLYVFEYMNGQPWYEVNPVIRQLPKFAEHA